MLRSTTSRCCTSACRSLQAAAQSPTMSTSRSASTSAVAASPSKSANAGQKKKATPEEQHQVSKRASQENRLRAHAGRLERAHKLAQMRIASLYHQALDFPSFQEPVPVSTDTETSTGTYSSSKPTGPVPLDEYIAGKLAQPLHPISVDARERRSTRHQVAAHHDPHNYMDEELRRTEFSLASAQDRGNSNNKKRDPKNRPWEAFAPDAPKEHRVRARRMVDALLGTVDASQPGPDMVRDISEVHKRMEEARQGRNQK